jgi:hypothetical protein
VLAQTDPTPKARAKERLAVRAAAGRVLEELRAAAATQSVDLVVLTDELSRRMLADAPAHRQAAQAKDQARSFVRSQRLAALGATLSNAVAAAQEQSPLPIQSGEVLQVLGSEWSEVVAGAADAFLSNHYDRVFADARLRAVAVQQREAEQRMSYPVSAAVDEKWSALVKEDGQPATNALDQLSGWLAAQAPKDQPAVFEEVERQQGEVGRRMAEEISHQYQRQLAAVAAACDRVPAAALEASQIEESLRGEARRAVEEAQRNATAAGRTVPEYPLFAASLRQVEREARRVEQQRLMASVEGWTDFDVTEGAVVKELEREPAKYRRAEESADRLAESATAAVRDRLAARHGGEKQAAHFADLLRGDQAAAARLRERVRAEVAKVLPAARARVAEWQLASLSDGLRLDRAFPDAVVAQWQDQGCRAVEKVDDALARLKEAGESAEAPKLIEEAATQVVARVGARVRAACEALGAQLQLVRALEKEKAEALQRDVVAARPVDKILREWRDELAARWSTAAGPESPYRKLLARTEDQLNKAVRQLYDAKQQEVAQATPVQATDSERKEPVPPQTTAVDKGSNPPEVDRDEDRDRKGGLGDETLLGSADVILNLTDTSLREARVVLKSADQELAAFGYDPAQAQAAADAIFAAVREPLARVLDERAAVWSRKSGGLFSFLRAEPPELKIYVIVESNEIRQRTSLLLRRRIKAQLDEWSAAHRPGQPPVALRWTVGLGGSGE